VDGVYRIECGMQSFAPHARWRRWATTLDTVGREMEWMVSEEVRTVLGEQVVSTLSRLFEMSKEMK
jgi:hypothetical protein